MFIEKYILIIMLIMYVSLSYSYWSMTALARGYEKEIEDLKQAAMDKEIEEYDILSDPDIDWSMMPLEDMDFYPQD